MSGTYPMQASALRIGKYVMIDGHPCKVISMSTSKTGKHGHAKCHIVGVDIFTSKKMDLVIASTHNVDVPNVTKQDYALVNIEDGYLSLMDDSGEIKEDVKLPPNEELANEIQSNFDEGKELIVNVLSAIGKEQVMSWKLSNN